MDADLADQRARAQWESRFCEAVIQPRLNDIEARLGQLQQVMVEDYKIGSGHYNVSGTPYT